MNSCSTIYHYTTISGLIGIISGKKLWASDCLFLNDGTELSYANDIFFSELNKLSLFPIADGGSYIIPEEVQNHFFMFITCFCKDGDLLSQWRGYGVDQGYSLGFDASKLKSLCNIDDVIPVEYGITNPSEYFAHELESATHRTGHPGMSIYYATEHFLPRIARIKNPVFKDEQEWRILKQLPVWLKNEDEEILFRESPMGPIPYVEIPFQTECLTEVIIGPSEHIDIREKAIRKILDYNNFREVTVRISEIPFRK